jgi:hypothetical protein
MIRSLVAVGAGLVVLAIVIFGFMINAQPDPAVSANTTRGRPSGRSSAGSRWPAERPASASA